MTRARLINASAYLAFASAGWCLVGAATPPATRQKPKFERPSTCTRRARWVKPTWHSGPATTPPENEVVLPPRDVPPTARLQLLGAHAEGKKPDVTKPPVAPVVGSNATESSGQRVQDELSRLRSDAGARRAFYDELRRTVEQVRSVRQEEKIQNPAFALPTPKPGWVGRGNRPGGVKPPPYNL